MQDSLEVLHWYDLWRIGNFLLCGLCVFILLTRYRQNSWSWNVKTTDYWYAFTVWASTGTISSAEGIFQDRELGFGVLLVSIAGLVTLKALLRQGAWGENSGNAQNV